MFTFKDAEQGPYLQAGNFFFETGEYCHTRHGHPGASKSSLGKVWKEIPLGTAAKERRKKEEAKAPSHQKTGNPPRPWRLELSCCLLAEGCSLGFPAEW